MIKVIFEISEEVIRECANYENAAAKMKADDGKRAVKALFDMMACGQLEKLIDEGKTEFVVTPDKLDDKSKELYNNELGEICSLAAFSETDNKSDGKEQ